MDRQQRQSRRPVRVLLIGVISLSVAGFMLSATIRAADAPPPAGTQKTKAAASTSRPTTRSAKDMSPEEMLSQMLKPQSPGQRPLSPLPAVKTGVVDKRSGAGAVAPAAPSVNVLREGTILIDRLGRLTKSADGNQTEFAFESDGTALQDPPVVILPNLKLMQLEDAVNANTTRELRFRVSGTVTEYRGRNYILLDKAVVVPEMLEKY
jgi:hypothetical protein